MSGRRDIAFWALVVVLGGGLILSSIPRDQPPGRSPDRSSLQVSKGGYAGWRILLEDQGIEANQLDQPPSAVDLDPTETIVGLDLGTLADRDAEALAAFVESGGRLIAGGRTSVESLEAISGTALDERDLSEPVGGGPLVPAPEVDGVAEIRGAGPSRYTDAGEGLPLFGSADGALVVELRRGEGEVVAVSDSIPLTNGELSSADNAQLAVDLVGAPQRSEVRFLERLAVGEEDAPSGLAALPDNWIFGFFGLIVAALVLIGSRLRRLGPATPPPSTVAEPRIGYVDAMAHTLARSGEPVAAAEPVRRAALAAIGGPGGPPRSTPGGRTSLPSLADGPDKLTAEAERAGVSPEDASALAGPLRTPADAVKATRALGRVWRRRF